MNNTNEFKIILIRYIFYHLLLFFSNQLNYLFYEILMLSLLYIINDRSYNNKKEFYSQRRNKPLQLIIFLLTKLIIDFLKSG